jgi:hypothetical protein
LESYSLPLMNQEVDRQTYKEAQDDHDDGSMISEEIT